MAAEIIPLIQAFVEIADWRQPSGKRYPLPAVLALACAAMLCGYRSYGAIAEWGGNYGQELVAALGFPNGKTPCASALHWIFRHLDCDQFESLPGPVDGNGLAGLSAHAPSKSKASPLTAKPCGAAKSKAHRAATCSRPSATAWASHSAQQAVADKSNELFQIEDLLEALVLTGRIVTMDALHTQRYVAQNDLGR